MNLHKLILFLIILAGLSCEKSVSDNSQDLLNDKLLDVNLLLLKIAEDNLTRNSFGDKSLNTRDLENIITRIRNIESSNLEEEYGAFLRIVKAFELRHYNVNYTDRGYKDLPTILEEFNLLSTDEK